MGQLGAVFIWMHTGSFFAFFKKNIFKETHRPACGGISPGKIEKG